MGGSARFSAGKSSAEPIIPRKADGRHAPRSAPRRAPGREIAFRSHSSAFAAERPAQTFAKSEGERVGEAAISVALKGDPLAASQLR